MVLARLARDSLHERSDVDGDYAYRNRRCRVGGDRQVVAVRDSRKVPIAAQLFPVLGIFCHQVKKSWDPLTYIPYVVSEARSSGRHPTEEGCEHFFRSSIQRAWITEKTGKVLEDVRINHKQRRVLFMGRASMTSAEGDTLRADGFQPLFHVEHAAGGTETAATNLWRVVILTGNRDDRYVQRFAARENWLPGFLEIYIRRDLKANLRRREPVDHA
jgi:hypothetical protein